MGFNDLFLPKYIIKNASSARPSCPAHSRGPLRHLQLNYLLESPQQRMRQSYSISHIECPWQSPYIYYADPSTRQCVVTCPTTPSLYANDYTQTCVNRITNHTQLAPGTPPFKPTTTTTTAAASYVQIWRFRLSLLTLLLRA
jgi:hypothetical protein